MTSFEAFPTRGDRGGILVVQEAFGLTTHIEDVTRRLAEAGWYAVAPALFHRQGAPVFAYDDVPSARAVMEQLSAGGIEEDVAAAFEHLKARGFAASQVGVVGFCMGGSVAFYAAAGRELGAAVTFYGGGIASGRFGSPSQIDLAPNLRTPWLGLYGDLDTTIPTDEVESLRTAMAGARVPTEIVRYADAAHGFNCDERPSVFNHNAAKNAWSRTLAWFEAHARA